jgi:hypothetical protein
MVRIGKLTFFQAIVVKLYNIKIVIFKDGKSGEYAFTEGKTE